MPGPLAAPVVLADLDGVPGWRLRATRRPSRRPGRAAAVPALPDAALRAWDEAALAAGRPLPVAAEGDGLATLAWPLEGGTPADAARAGRTAAHVPALGAAEGVAVWWTDPDGVVTLPGGTGPTGRGGSLHVVAPAGTTVARLVDGAVAGPPDVVGTGEWPAWYGGLHRVELLREDARGRLRRWVLPTPALLLAT